MIFLGTALVFHFVLRYTRYGKFTYAIGANPQAARVSGINVARHLIVVYTIAGTLSDWPESSPRRVPCQVRPAWDDVRARCHCRSGDRRRISLGGIGRITGTVIGTMILGVVTSGFTFLRIDAYYQEIVKGAIIIAAVIADQYRQKARGQRA